MPTITPISRDTHGTKRWKRYANYKFAASDAVAHLVISELPRAALALPISFIAQGDDFMPAAVLGFAAGQNLLVAPDGRWAGLYIPAAFRGYPFALAKAADDREILCIREDSGLVTDGPEGEPFFDENGGPSKAIADVLLFLQQISTNRKTTQRVCAVLKEHGLIQPWPITIKTPAGDQNVEGLNRIDEAALNALPGEAFLKLREAGGLAVAYCQLMSMQHLSGLGQLAAATAEAAARKLPVNEAGELDLEFMNDGPMMDFSRLK